MGGSIVANYLPGERVMLASEKAALINKLLMDGAQADDVSYQVTLQDSGIPETVKESDIVTPLPPRTKDFFDRQRDVARRILGDGDGKIEEFAGIMRRGHGQIGSRAVVNAEVVFEHRRPLSSPGASVVFMGMKTVPEAVVGAIHKYGITALKYLHLADKVDAGYAERIKGEVSSDRQASTFRNKFLFELPWRTHPSYPTLGGLDEFRLLKIVNAHKTGDTQNSGYHSTSGKPQYASEYSEASGQVLGKTEYNLGVAIELSDDCYPVVIQEALEHWNARTPASRYGKETITMAFDKKAEGWERDYESEILLGGATAPSDFVYLGIWAVQRATLGPMAGIKLGLQGFDRDKQLKKTGLIPHK